MSKRDKRSKGCVNESCNNFKNKRKFIAEDIYCTICQNKLKYICKRCGAEFESENIDDLYCSSCDEIFAERKEKAMGTVKNAGKTIKTGATVVVAVGPQIKKVAPKAGVLVEKAKPVANVITKMGK